MCQLIRLSMVWFFIGIVIIPTTVFADNNPRPGSQTALNGLVQSYRRTIIELMEFQEKSKEIQGFPPSVSTSHTDQILSTIIMGLDNIDNDAANQLVLDFSGVYFGSAPAAVFSSLVNRKGRKLKKYLKKDRLLTDWCIKKLPAGICHEEGHALSSLLDDIEEESHLEYYLSIYPYP
ncbi:hypothetical protein [Verminephrobacter aporrectodeae]|uniref:hypothetical protein n=2 Tax=Verminephrobacter aporrectodeae TaxID=1110389 RepID=UPI002239146B|nr:hypothetical protein [Verminephrobacter aporrectodeae]